MANHAHRLMHPSLPSNIALRPYAIIGHMVSWLLIILSGWLYQERLNIDAAHYIYKVINNEWFRVECGRLVLALSQILPLLAIKLGLSLKMVLIAYSLNNPIYHYIFFNVFLYGFKHTGAAIAVVLIQLVGLSYGFFTPMYEMYYGAPCILLCYLLLQKQPNIWRYMIMVVAAIFAASSHMAGIILLVFAIGLDYAENRQLRIGYWLAIAMVVAGVLMYKAVFPNEYETEVIAFSFDFSRNQRWQNLFHTGYLKQLGIYLIKHYWEAFALLVPPILSLAFAREKLQLAYVVLAVVGYLVLIQAMHNGIILSRYSNQVYFPFVLLVAIIFMYRFQFYPAYARKLLALLVVVVLISRFDAITTLSTQFRHDVVMMKSMAHHAHTLGGSKFATNQRNVEHDPIISAHWSFPIQTLLISAIDGPEEAITIHFDKYLSGLNLNEHQHVFRFQEVVTDASLNPNYFRLKPGAYVPLQQSLPDSILEISSWDKLQWQLGNAYKVTKPKNSFISMYLQLNATEGDTIFVNANNNIFFSYHWLQNGDTIVWDGLRTAVEVDITREYIQRLMVQTPRKPGTYTLEVDLVHEGVKWFGRGKRYEILLE